MMFLVGNLITDQPGDTNWQCSRYDGAYPNIINDAIGPSVTDFQFVACSGDRTGGIYNQIKALKGSLDLVVMTAGGNDLCLVSRNQVLVALNETDSLTDA
jgi:lysophospholipase L1-like esterase